MWEQKLKQRQRVCDKYLLPKLYKLDYQIEQIKKEQRQLVKRGRRRIYIEADVVVEINNQPAIVITVRSGAEEITDYIIEQTLSYARLLVPPAVIIAITNGLETKVYNVETGEELAAIPKEKELRKMMKADNDLPSNLRAKALNEVFTSISSWDKTEQKSEYHFYSIPAYNSQKQETIFNNQLFHNGNYSPNVVTAENEVSIRVSSYQELVDEMYIYYTVDGTVPRGEKGLVKQGQKIELNYKYSEQNEDGNQMVKWWSAEIPQQEEGTWVRYIIEGYNTKLEQSYFADGAQELKNANLFSYLVQDYATPEWAKNAVVYQIMVDRFFDGDPTNNYDLSYQQTGYQGGDLEGIIEKLNYINELGATAIWLSPIYQGTDYHGYHITDFLEVDQHFGDEETLKRLVEKAHQLGIKVILDFVPSHTSYLHPYFVEATTDKNSSYYQWYDFKNWPEEYEQFCGVAELPSFNTNNPGVRQHIIYQQALQWVIDFNIDGLRLDHANGPSHDFWVEFRKVIKKHKPEVYIFGEVWEGPKKIKKFEGELDGCFDFSLVWSFRDLFISGSKTISEFKADLDYLNDYYQQEFIINRFLDNHDMSRFLWEAKGDKEKLKLAATCQFTLAGTPFIYYGTEVGLSQQEPCFDDNTGRIIFDNSRDFMLWEDKQDKELYHFYQKLCKIRKENKVLVTGKRKDLIIDDQKQVWGYSRYDEQEEILIILNLSLEEQKIDINLAKSQKRSQNRVLDLLTREKHQIIDEELQLILA
ncbi:MAG: alpha-amylase family glycosyl hydrolase, partial [Bacillota bacterium]